MSIATQVETLEAVATGALTAQDAAARLGVTEAELKQLQHVYALSAELTARNERARTEQRDRLVRRVGVSVAAMAALAVGLTNSAWAQTMCTQTLPSPMVTFCPDSPATASSVNGNFQQLVTWMQQKVGTVGSANVSITGTLTAGTATTTNLTTTNATVTGTLTAPNAFLNGPIVRGTVMPGTGDLGLFSQISGNYLRFVTNAAPVYWFADGSASNNYVGSTATMILEANGNLNVGGELRANAIRQRSCFWGTRGPPVTDDGSYHSVYCPAGTFMAGWQCKANGYIDGDCAAYCCYP